MKYKNYSVYLIVLFFIDVLAFINVEDDELENYIAYSMVLIIPSLLIYSLFILDSTQEKNVENFPVPYWFKKLFRNVIDNMAEIRFLQIFLFYPLLFVTPIVYIGVFSLFYTGTVTLLVLIYFAIKWIIKGKNKPFVNN